MWVFLLLCENAADATLKWAVVQNLKWVAILRKRIFVVSFGFFFLSSFMLFLFFVPYFGLCVWVKYIYLFSIQAICSCTIRLFFRFSHTLFEMCTVPYTKLLNFIYLSMLSMFCEILSQSMLYIFFVLFFVYVQFRAFVSLFFLQ